MFNYLEAIESNISHFQLEKVHQYIKMILNWNRTTNITSKNNAKARIYDFICEGIAMSKLINDNSIVADIGSGNGFPGIVLSILGIHCNLIEINSKKAAFLQYVTAELNLTAKVHNIDVKNLQLDKIDFITSKAVTTTDELMRMCNRICNENTKYILCKNGHHEIILTDKKGFEKTYSFLVKDNCI